MLPNAFAVSALTRDSPDANELGLDIVGVSEKSIDQAFRVHTRSLFSQVDRDPKLGRRKLCFSTRNVTHTRVYETATTTTHRPVVARLGLTLDASHVPKVHRCYRHKRTQLRTTKNITRILRSIGVPTSKPPRWRRFERSSFRDWCDWFGRRLGVADGGQRKKNGKEKNAPATRL
tara:strand:+ start:1394 stop:1918 length:525 start_codon:yes stop_codon:yes gene_type:complete